jgi:Zn-dependent metalloprotease
VKPTNRHSIFCILPPHILINIAKNAETAEQRAAAVDALSVDHTIRNERQTAALMGRLQVEDLSSVSLDAAGQPQNHRTIYDCSHSTSLPGRLVRGEGQDSVADESVNRAYDGLGATFDFYLNNLQRNSIDNKGLPLVASVHYGSKYNNAFWNGQQMVFGDGDGILFNDFTISLDVIGHELTHGVTGSEANLVYQRQPGALNESISDVFGSMVKQYKTGETADKADWLIGEGLLTAKVKGTALRSMAEPGTAYDDPVLGKDPQPADMQHYVNTASDNGGVHINSGIPNRAFYLAATSIGGYSWTGAGLIWYDTVVDKNLKATANFATFANLTVRHAGTRFGVGSSQQKAVADAWQRVGVLKKASQKGA